MDENLMNTEVETDIESDVVGLDGYEDTSSVEEPEVADPEGAEDETQGGVETPSVDVNAIAAAARRKAEEEKRQALAEIDNYYATQFGHLTNPKTGAPIRSERDYREALSAQEEMRTKAELESKGIDPTLIDKAVANNPIVRQAQDLISANERADAINRINNDVDELGQLDPSIKSFDDVPPNVIEMSMNSNGAINLVNAYKILNYGKVSEGQKASIQQSAINQAKGKAHLNPVNGVATPEEGVEIPSSVLSMWKEVFPDKTKAELKKLYNDSL